MAEVRKFNPGKGGSIAEQVAKAMGESVRPVTPGAPPNRPAEQPAEKTTTKKPTANSNSGYDIFTTTTSTFTFTTKADPTKTDDQ